MGSLILDIRLACRMMLRQPAVTLVVVFTLALGLGANAVIFSAVDALVLRPFPTPAAGAVVMFAEVSKTDGFEDESVAPGNFLEWRRQVRSIQPLVAMDLRQTSLMGKESADNVYAADVTAGLFEAMGSPLALGTPFTRDDERPGSARKVILSHGLWTTRFGADPNIVGQTVMIERREHVVSGVAAQDFQFPTYAEIWTPLGFTADQENDRRARYLTVIGKLADGATLEDARAEMGVISQRLRDTYPEDNRAWTTEVRTLNEGMRDLGAPTMLAVWQTAAAFVLLIACANVANLLLARGTARQREIAVRRALGGSRFAIIRQMLVESVLLSALAAAAGLYVAAFLIDVLRTAMPEETVRFVAGWQTMDVDGRLVVFIGGCCLLASLVFGWGPALQASRHAIGEGLKDGGRSATEGRGRHRLRNALVVSEITLSTVLLVASGLTVFGTQRLLTQSWGFDSSNLFVFKLRLAEDIPEPRRALFFQQLIARLESEPEVQAVALANALPASNTNTSRGVLLEGQVSDDSSNLPRADFRPITNRYLETLRIPLLQGRTFGSEDRTDTQPVAIVSRSMVNRFWPNEDPIGKRFQIGGGPARTVVGISGDVVHHWFDRRNFPTVYVPFEQSTPVQAGVAVRSTSRNPEELVERLRAIVRSLDPAQPIFEASTMERAVFRSSIGLWYGAAIMGALGLLALVLATTGVYSVMSYAVSQRTHEFGVRIALGAASRNIVGITLRQSALLTVTGLGIGLALSLPVGYGLASVLFGIVQLNVATYAGFTLVLALAAFLAALVPARRALRVDPIAVLRRET